MDQYMYLTCKIWRRHLHSKVLLSYCVVCTNPHEQMVCIETVVTGFVDEFPRFGLNKVVRFLTTLSICVILFVCGIPMTTQVRL